MTNEDIRESIASANREAASGFNVGGYLFKSRESAKEAKSELNAIRYVSAKTDLRDPKQVYLLYNKLLDKELFRTLIGIEYLKELQQFLYECEDIPNDRIRDIPVDYDVQAFFDSRREITRHKSKIIKLEKSRDRYKDYFIKTIIVNIFLVIVIVAMMIIMKTSDNPTVIDYENKLQNRYSRWEAELESREAVIKNKEKELNIQEKMDKSP